MKTRLQKYFGPIANAVLLLGKVILATAVAVPVVVLSVGLALSVPFLLGYGGAVLAGAANPLAWGVGFAGVVVLLRVLGSAIHGEDS